MRAAAELEVAAGQRIRWRCTPPMVLRRTGPDRVHLVQAAGGPLGGDEIELRVRLAEGACLTVATAGATVAQPGVAPDSPAARVTVRAVVAEGAHLCWWPEPTVVCDGARLHTDFGLHLADGASALVREEVRLGRFGQLGGSYRGGLSADYAGEALLRHTTVLDGADPGLAGPAGTAGGQVVATVLGAGLACPHAAPMVGESTGLCWAWQDLAGPGWLLMSVGDRRPDLSWLTGTRPEPATEAIRTSQPAE
ncbi:MAG TPA: urease accessory protein UreD [Pseudonocardia sp.]|uniref:urease accessory protein UreD n=1 Tax=Pseudonocardia sp. TaxID=60912 RepID=UPI002F412684